MENSVAHNIRQVITTNENEHGDAHRMITDPETRMTMNFVRNETVGFENKPFDMDDHLARLNQ